MLVRTQSMYAALYDEESPVNTNGFLNDLIARAKVDQRTKALGPGGWLFVFNDYLLERTRRGELVPWTLLIDGVFRCNAELVRLASDLVERHQPVVEI